jgi:hypothetical protein
LKRNTVSFGASRVFLLRILIPKLVAFDSNHSHDLVVLVALSYLICQLTLCFLKLFAFLFSDKIPWMCKECSCPAMSGSMRCKSDFFCSLLNELFSELFSGIERRDHISWNIIAINVETEERRIKKISSWSLQIWWKLLCEEFSGSWTIILLYIFRFALAASLYLLCTFPYHKKLRGFFESLGYVVFFPLMNYMYRCVEHVMIRIITNSSAYICDPKYSPPFTSTLWLCFWFFQTM